MQWVNNIVILGADDALVDVILKGNKESKTDNPSPAASSWSSSPPPSLLLDNVRLSLLEFQQQNTDCEEYENPYTGRSESTVYIWILNLPPTLKN